VTLSADDIAAGILKRHDAAAGNRGIWEAHWEEIAQRIWPSYAGTFTGSRSEGEKRTELMVDATAALALPKFAAAMESMLTPRNSTWHRLVPIDKTLQRNRVARMWYDEVNDLLFRYRYAPRANYASQQHEVYMGLGAFGTGAMYVDKLDWYGERGLRYQAVHLGEMHFYTNHQGIVDGSSRKFELTARQAVQQFGAESLPEDIANAAKDPAKAENRFFFVHCIQPRGEELGYDPQRADVKGMRYASHYVSVTGKRLVREGGYNTFPYPISRYVTGPREVYGRSPAMLALPSIKTLNEIKKTILKQGHRVVDPVILAHDDGILDGFSLRPGAVNAGAVNAQGQVLVHTLPTGNLAAGKEMTAEERMAINDAFLVTLFQILVDTPQMTATEVIERSREKGALLSPTMGRQQSEFLGPMVERELDVLAAQGLLPEMPPIVRQAQAEYDTLYDNPLSRAQRAESAAGAMRVVDYVRDLISVTQDPSPMDWFDTDAMIPALADQQAVPSGWLRDQRAVDAVRKQRADAAQTQQMIDAAPAAAGVMKALPQVTTRLTGNA
jgi:hypothetical protein